ncbi:MAG: DUF952 domain-containing protein [Bauldia sp.]
MRIFKICRAAEWADAERTGTFPGSPDDRRDGFIHFSTAGQLQETVSKHFAGQSDLVIVAFEDIALGKALRWEPARGGRLFPHLYAPLASTVAIWVKALPLAADGTYRFPDLGA